MRILLVHNRYLQLGGEDRVVEMESQLLRDREHEVVLYEEHNRSIEHAQIAEMTLRSCWSQDSFNKIRALLKADKFDLVHVHNFFPLISPSVYFAAKSASVPVVQTLHNYRLLCANALFFREGRPCTDCVDALLPFPGVVHRCYKDSYLASLAVAGMSCSHRLIGTWHNMVDRYIAISQFQYQKFVEAKFPVEKMTVKGNLIYPDPGQGPSLGNYALFVGRLSKEKGILTLLDSWRQFIGNRMPLLIVGDGALRSVVEQACVDLPSIRWLGFLQSEQVIELMGNAKMVIVPSEWFEPFGLVAIEALAKGTPVVAANIGALADIIRDRKTGLLFEPGNPLDLADKLLQLSNDPELLLEMRGNARQEYILNYNVDKNYSELLGIYEDVRSPQRLG